MTENDTHAMKILSPTIAGGAAAFLSEILLLADILVLVFVIGTSELPLLLFQEL